MNVTHLLISCMFDLSETDVVIDSAAGKAAERKPLALRRNL